MAVEINGAPLTFTAQIEDKDFDKGIENILRKTKALQDAEMKRFEVGIKKQTEYNKLLLQNPGVNKNLDAETALQVKAFQKLEAALNKLKKDKEDLNAAFAKGNTGQDVFRAKLAEIVQEEQKLAKTMAEVSIQLSKSDSLQKAGTAAITAKRRQLEQLEQAYLKLSTAEQGGDKGKSLQNNIANAKQELKSLEGAFRSLSNNAFNNLAGKVQQLEEFKRVADEIQGTDGLSFEVDFGLLPEKMEQLETLKKELAELEETRSAKLNLTTDFDKVAEDIQAYETALSSLNEKELALTNSIDDRAASLLKNEDIQKIATANVEDQIAKLESLKLSYSQLSEEDKGSNRGLALASSIEKLKGEVEGLNAALKDTGSGVSNETAAKIQGVVQLKDQYRSLLTIQKELANVKVSKIDLESNLKSAAIDVDTYGKSLQNLEDQERDLLVAYQKQSDAIRLNAEFQKSGTELIKERTKEIAKLKAAYQNLPTSSKIDVSVGGEMKASIAELEQELTTLKNILNNLDSSGNFNKSAASAQQFRKSIESIEIEMASYEAIVRKATDPGIIKQYTAEIKKLQKEIQQMKNAGAEGYDRWGRPLKEQLSIIGRLERAAQLYKNAIATATDPDNITKYNKKLEDVETRLTRAHNAGRTGFDAVGNAIEKNNNKLSQFRGTLVNIAGAFGLVGLVDTLVDFGRELVGVSVKASGVDRAFSKIGDATYLEKLRKETKGFVSDFELERLTVKANNLNIPLKDMGTYLLFASTRAKETGESVEKMTDDIVEGLGKESLRIIDNLGISQKAVREEMKAGGTMAEAVGRIMRREMGEAGVEVDTLADKTNRMSATWDNAKKSIAGFFTRLANPQGANDQVIGALTKRATDQLKFDKANADQRQRIINDQIKKVADLSKAYEQAQRTAATSNSGLDGGRADRMAKQAGEELQAAKNVLQTIKEQNREFEKKERINRGNLTIAEAEERLAKAQENLQNTDDDATRKKYQKQVDDYTNQLEVLRRNGNAEFGKLLSDVDTNYKKLVDMATDEEDLKQIQEGLRKKIGSLAPNDKEIGRLQVRLKEVNKLLEGYEIKEKAKGQALDNRSYEQRIALLQKLAELETKYNAKNLSPDELANEQLQDEFKKMANEIGKFNRDPKNKIKIPVARLEELRVKATADLVYKQETEKLKIEMERQKGIFQEYENFKLVVGKEEADKRFAYDKKAFDNYGAYVESELAKMDTSKNLTPAEQQKFDMLKNESKAYWEQERKLRTQNLQEALVATATFEQQRATIIAKFAKLAQELRNTKPNQNVDREIQELNRLMQVEINNAADAALKKTKIYQDASKQAIDYTKAELKAQIEATKKVLELTKGNNLIPDTFRTDLEAELSGLTFTLGLDDSSMEEIEADIAKINLALADINIGPEVRQNLEKQLGTLELKLKFKTDGAYLANLKKEKQRIEKALSSSLTTPETAAELRDKLAGVNEEIDKAEKGFGEIAERLQKVSVLLNAAANLVSKIDVEAGKALNTFSGIASSAGAIFAGLASKDPLAVLTGSIGVISGLVDLMDRSDEKREAAAKRQQIALEKTKSVLQEMSRLLSDQARAIERALGVDKITSYKDQLNLINIQFRKTISDLTNLKLNITVQGRRRGEQEIQSYAIALKNLNDLINQTGRGTSRPVEGGLDTIEAALEANRKVINEIQKDLASGSLSGQVEELKELIAKYQELEEQVEQYKAKLQEVLTGTTFGSIVDSMADGFKQGFKNAEQRAKFFADTFKDLMKNSIIESLKMQALEGPLKRFYDDFAKASDSDGGLDAGEIEDLERIYKEILTNAEKKFAELQKLAGIDFADPTNSNANSLQGGIERMSQQTAEIIAGQLSGMRLGIIDISQTAKQILAAIISPGTANIPAAGNNTFSIPGMLEVANNTAQIAGSNERIALSVYDQLQISIQALSYHKEIAQNTGMTATAAAQIVKNTDAINNMATTLKNIEKNQTSGSNALNANGFGRG
ncbi:hypothetical protein [Adhaeribacter aquaticus]|uniref:hypothetical protein n=1 Tax=Adhaeribacter aquaticus TaxID=299567 RepID=UPI0004114587|nr:hypothetical protein [Adhaeribacter aquaticus]